MNIYFFEVDPVHFKKVKARLASDPEGVLPFMGYIGMCGPKEYGFSAVLGINWVSILAIITVPEIPI